MKYVFLSFFLVLFSFSARADIIWAAAGPYTGSVASIGQAQQAGIKQAVEDINASGGINGQKITLKFYDDACDPKQAVAVANKIIADNFYIVLHGSCSGASLAASKVYLEEGALVMNTISSNPKITDDGGPTLFRTMFRDDVAAGTLADMLLKRFHNSKLAIIHDKTAYGQGLAEFVRDKVSAKGLTPVLFEPFDSDNHDYSVLISRLKQANIDVLFIGGTPVAAGIITRQLRESGSKIQIVAGDLGDPDFWKIAGNTGEGALFAQTTDPRKEPGAKEVVLKLQKSGAPIDSYTVYAYAAAQALAQAMAKTASSDPAKIAKELHSDEFNTILGKWSFDEKGDVRNIHLAIYQWHNGQFGEVKE